jgi:hypothetical protein
MNATASPVASEQESVGTRLRKVALATAFALVLLVPKLLRLRHNPQTWMTFRILLAISGATLVVVPLSIATGWFGAIVGMAMFLTAILLPGAKPDHSIDEKAKQLGALVVVNGGKFEHANTSTSAQLFISAEQLYVLDSDLRELLAIPVAEISSLNVAESHDGWVLRVRWAEYAADFEYAGVFAEHLARVADSSIHGVMRPALPVLPQSRAASA